MSDHAGAPLHVVAGVLRDVAGRVLLAQRPPGKHLAGLWEFPGGKLEPDETPTVGLARELCEELGIDVEPGTPLIRVPWQYGERGLLLDAWQITQWQGTPASLEGQALQWCAPIHVDPATLAPADRPILQAMRLPARYPITPDTVLPADFETWFVRVRDAITRGDRLLQLRLPQWSQALVRELAGRLQPLALAHDAQLLLNADIEGARQLGVGVGVHLKSAQLTQLTERPLPWQQPVGASCHDAEQLMQAVRLGADFATLSPLAVTDSHPDASPLGWPSFRVMTEAAALPVYALGGVSPMQLAEVQQAGGQGVAGIRAFW